jgi:hypothetical protein
MIPDRPAGRRKAAAVADGRRNTCGNRQCRNGAESFGMGPGTTTSSGTPGTGEPVPNGILERR